MQSKQYILHSLLCESACNLHWTKKCSFSKGFNHGGHLLSSSSGPPAPYTVQKNTNQNQIPNTHYHKNGKWNRKKSNTNHNSPVLGLDFTNSSFLIVDRQLDSLICSNGYSISNKTQNKYNLKIGTRDFETSCVDI